MTPKREAPYQNVVPFNNAGLGRERPAEPLQPGGGGGNYTGMDPALQRLDDKIDNRFLWLLGVFGAGFVLLASLILNTTGKLDDKLDARFDQLEAKIGKVSDQMAAVSERTAKLEGAAESRPPPVRAKR